MDPVVVAAVIVASVATGSLLSFASARAAVASLERQVKLLSDQNASQAEKLDRQSDFLREQLEVRGMAPRPRSAPSSRGGPPQPPRPPKPARGSPRELGAERGFDDDPYGRDLDEDEAEYQGFVEGVVT